MSVRKLVFVCTLFLCLAGGAYAQSLPDTITVPLTVEKGFPLQVVLTKDLRFKKNEKVRAKIVEPVYSFDRQVIPVGTLVEGTITGFRKAGKWKRITAKIGGNFTPQHEPQITFHTLVLRDGTRFAIDTAVVPGAEKTVRLDAGKSQSGNGLKSALMSTVKKSGGNRFKNLLWGMLPYHPRSLPDGTLLNAVLLEPLDFGEADLGTGALDQVGSQPPVGSIASVRLITPLDSGTTLPGAPIEALLTRPVFSPDRKLIFPEGSTLRGTVIGAKRARSFHRNGQLAFSFTTIEPPASLTPDALPPLEVDVSLFSAQVTRNMKDLRISEEGTRIVESKKRFIAPAWAFIKIDRAVGATADSFDAALLGAYRGKFIKELAGTDSSGFGLTGSISGALVPPVAVGLGIYGAARSVYSGFLGRGRNIVLPANTAMQVRLGNVAARDENESTTAREKD